MVSLSKCVFHFLLSRCKPGAASKAEKGYCIIDATVDVRELMGSEVYLYLKHGEYQLTARAAPITVSQTGAAVQAAVNMNKAHLFANETEAVIMN